MAVLLFKEEELEPHEKKRLKKVKAMDDSSEEEEDGKFYKVTKLV